MTELLFWFLVSQTVAGLPGMSAGTEVRVVSPDLLTIFATATVVDARLEFESALPPGAEVRLLLFPPDASATEVAEALSGAAALRGRVSDNGRDLLISFSEIEGFLSFRKWLREERGVTLVIPLGSDG